MIILYNSTECKLFLENVEIMKKDILSDVLFCGALEGIRTPDLLVRSQTLYPAELQAQISINYNSTEILICQV